MASAFTPLYPLTISLDIFFQEHIASIHSILFQKRKMTHEIEIVTKSFGLDLEIYVTSISVSCIQINHFIVNDFIIIELVINQQELIFHI